MKKARIGEDSGEDVILVEENLTLAIKKMWHLKGVEKVV